jgi:hypothetical protein
LREAIDETDGVDLLKRQLPSVRVARLSQAGEIRHLQMDGQVKTTMGGMKSDRTRRLVASIPYLIPTDTQLLGYSTRNCG